MPNQPKTRARNMRIPDPEWEGFGTYAEIIGSDRTKLVAAFIDHCLGRPGVDLPEPVDPDVFAARLEDALETVREQLLQAADPQQADTLRRRQEGLRVMLDEVRNRLAAR